MTKWRPIATGPKEFVHAAADHPPFVWLWIPEIEAVYPGYWSEKHQCWRYEADDGPEDCQPSLWQPMKAPKPPGNEGNEIEGGKP